MAVVSIESLMWVMCSGTKPFGNQQNDNDDDSTGEFLSEMTGEISPFGKMTWC